MKKHRVELIVLFLISVIASVLIPNCLKHNSGVEFPPLTEFVILTVISFVISILAYFAVKPPLDKETMKNMKPLPNGYHELFNSKDQITKKGFFIGGKLFEGSQYVYSKDGTLSHIEKYQDGVYIGNVEKNK